jgi:high-affinity Fe2+/Pb2+ permease
MVSEADKYTPQSAKLAGEYLFGGLLLFGLVIFCLLISTDCYLNSVTCEVSVAAFVVALGVAIVVVWWRDRVASEKGEDMLKQIAAPIVMGFFLRVRGSVWCLVPHNSSDCTRPGAVPFANLRGGTWARLPR